MAHRHLARSVALQTLFELDFKNVWDGATAQNILRKNIDEFAPGIGDSSFILSVFRGVLGKRGDLDAIIAKAAPDWPLAKISLIDRNVLRIGLFELLFEDKREVPAKVAINEAIELAKTFGGENSGKFVNGVIGAVYKELGEPGKDEGPKRKKKKEDVPYEKMPVQKLGGAVVFAREGKDTYLALVHDIFGRWTLSKGKIAVDETPEAGTVRKIKEELGIDISIREDLGTNEYVASDPELGKIRKHVHYFLGEAAFQNLKLGTTGGLDDARWFKLKDIIDLNFYSDILPIITKAVHLLAEK